MIYDLYSEPVKQTYKAYKNSQFNKKLEKMRQLINSVDDTSLSKEDKIKLKVQMREQF